MSTLEPGSRIGVFGGGQLGRMFAHAAQRCGYHVFVYSPEEDGPAHQVTADSYYADYEDTDAVRDFAKSVDVITLEFENIPLVAVEEARRWCPVRPSPAILQMAQHRIVEKSTLRRLGFPVTPFVGIDHENALQAIEPELGWPCILKTATSGYDGKGQRKVDNYSEALEFWNACGGVELIAEKRIEFLGEVSILVARNPRGHIVVYPMFFNEHTNHILDVTLCPAPDRFHAVQSRAHQIASDLAAAIQLEGILCIEFFVDTNLDLLINELAPRPHNSGHLTIEGTRTSQFEQQLRAICNLPLGDVSLNHPRVAMANLLGDLWETGTPKFDVVFHESTAALHLYGKSKAKKGRKMGHLTAWGPLDIDLETHIKTLRHRLVRN